MSDLGLDDARKKREELRSEGRTVVFTNGCFDLIHPGHVHILEQAAAQGDYLIVGVNTDDSVRRLKGGFRPVQGESARVTVLNALESVDDTILFDEDTPKRLIQELSPDVLVKGADYEVSEIVGADHVQSTGGRVHRVELLSGHGTSEIIETILGAEPE